MAFSRLKVCVSAFGIERETESGRWMGRSSGLSKCAGGGGAVILRSGGATGSGPDSGMERAGVVGGH